MTDTITKMVLASRNRKKITELQVLLRAFFPNAELLSLDDIGFVGDIEEDGTTFEENALIKATAACRASGLPGIADDSGLTVEALNGAPGVYSARYAGGHGNDDANNEKLLRELSGVPQDKRAAAYVACVAVVFPDGRNVTAMGDVKGVIIDRGRGEGGFGYDPYFFYPPFDKTMAEMTAEEKNGISHRANAIRSLCEKIKEMK